LKELMPEGQLKRLLDDLLGTDGWRDLTLPRMRLTAGLHWIAVRQQPDGRWGADVR
jgi:hypothetical protein